ncbi:MAG: hypothetical protein ACI4EA_04085 [Candidatus Ornithomonoglobus sp.]
MEELINKRVIHKLWGTGVITEASGKAVKVDFNGEIKKFVYPDAFKRFLVFEENNLQEKTDNLLEERNKREAEEKEAEERARRLAQKLQQLEKFRKEKEKRSGRREVRHDNPAFRCESVFTGDGVIRAGADSRGKARRFRGLEANKLAILTAAGMGIGESNRMILEVFLIDDVFEGNEYREGFVKSSPKYRIRLTGEEASRLRFWDYCKSAGMVKWGTGLFRDVDDKTAAKLLEDIVRIKKDTEAEDTAKELYDYFYKIHKYTIEG